MDCSSCRLNNLKDTGRGKQEHAQLRGSEDNLPIRNFKGNLDHLAVSRDEKQLPVACLHRISVIQGDFHAHGFGGGKS